MQSLGGHWLGNWCLSNWNCCNDNLLIGFLVGPPDLASVGRGAGLTSCAWPWGISVFPVYFVLFCFVLAVPHGMQDLLRPEIQSMPPALGAWRRNCWTTRGVRCYFWYVSPMHPLFLVTSSKLFQGTSSFHIPDFLTDLFIFTFVFFHFIRLTTARYVLLKCIYGDIQFLKLVFSGFQLSSLL